MSYSIEKHGRRWRVRWRESGQIQRRSFDTPEGAQAFIELLQSEREARRAAEARRNAALTVADVVDAYYQRRKRRLEPSTQYHYEQVIRANIAPALGDLPARDIAEDPAVLQDFYDDLPPKVAVHCHEILRPAFQLAVNRRVLDRNPCEVARPPRPRKKERLIPTKEEAQKLLIAAEEEDPTFGLFVSIVGTLGLRRGEACALRWENLDFGKRTAHIRLAVARTYGGTYIKVPKSGEERSLLVGRSFFDRLEPFRRDRGWLFPRAYNAPYRGAETIGPQTSAGRLLAWLHTQGGTHTSPEGRAGTEAAAAIGLGHYSAGPMLRWLEAEGYLTRDRNPSRIHRLSLTDTGKRTVEAWDTGYDDGLPWFPTTPGARFKAIAERLEMPYRLHSLRHYVATHLYNQCRDWVQLSRFLGHRSPSITMGIYANHVVEPSQLALGEAAAQLLEA